MSELPSTARVVVIGGGCVGASCLYHLAKAGWTDSILLEKNELTSGSTWHAAGNVPTFSASWGIMNIQRYSAELYRGLADAVDYPMNYHVTGSVRLAHSVERMREFARVRGMGTYQGMALELLSPDEIRGHYPFIELHDLEGALYDPYDGDIDPAQLTQALAKGARDLGATILRFCPATGARREGGEWVVETDKGEIRCEIVVNAAGYRAQEVGRWFGRDVPMATMAHQYVLFEEVPEVRAWSESNGRKLPLLRDVDSSYYLRQEKFGFNLGPYERNGRAHWVTPDDPMPADFSFQLYPDDLERIEWYVGDALARVPAAAEAGVSKIINGPIPYTPDGHPLIGPMPGVPNAFEACVFTFGICQAGGAGKVLAEWVTEGATEQDMWAVDPRRFGPWCDQDYCTAKALEVYGHEYAMHFPRHSWPAGRPKRVSALYDRLTELGAQFGQYGGWERANWFAAEGDDTSEAATQTWGRDGPWEPRIRAEAEAVRDRVGVLDLCGFSRFRIEGPGSAAWLRSQVTGGIPKIGRIGLVYMTDTRGRIVTEFSVLRDGEEEMTLITAAAAQEHDRELLLARRPADAGFGITDVTEGAGALILAGPQTRRALGTLTAGDLEAPWLSHQIAYVAGRPARLVRVSFTGELGWEIHATPQDLPTIYDAVLEAGATPFGMFALDSLRVEKGYRAWKGDLSTDYTMFEAGLDRFVKLDKAEDFPGKAALLNERQQGSKKGFVTMTLAANGHDAPYMATVWRGDEVVGETTSGAWGYRVGASIALGVVRADCAEPGTPLEVEVFGERVAATVSPVQSLWDPENARLRA
ncbi:MAG: FAD-dependent oxidoreductase [Paracoccaceae bacterium]